jgi:hypothetical protein
MTDLAEMSVTEAVSKALEAIIYGDYEDAKNPNPEYHWRTPYEGTFEDYLKDYFRDAFDGDDHELDLDTDQIWQNLHSEGGEGTKDGFTGKVEASFGGEGEGDQYWMVISVSDGTTTRYFRRDGWYASYDGGYLDGETYEVSPKEKVIVVYES